MNELTLLERLNAEVPEPVPEVVLRARRELLRRAIEPQARRSGLRPIVAPVRQGRYLPRLAAAGVASLVLAGGLIVVETLDGPGGASAQAATVLLAASRSAAEQPHTGPEPDQFMYVRTRASWASTVVVQLDSAGSSEEVTYLQPQLYEAWVSVDGTQSGLVRKTFDEPVFLDPNDEATLSALGIVPPSAGSVDETVLDPNPSSGSAASPDSYAYLESLPTDPDALFDLIREQAEGKGQSLEQQMLEEVASALRFSVAPPDVRAALYEVAARIDGVQIVPGTTDFDGRQGTTVAVITNGLRWELIFDPESAELLGTRTVVVTDQPGLDAGTVLGSDSTTVTVVDELPAR